MYRSLIDILYIQSNNVARLNTCNGIPKNFNHDWRTTM